MLYAALALALPACEVAVPVHVTGVAAHVAGEVGCWRDDCACEGVAGAHMVWASAHAMAAYGDANSHFAVLCFASEHASAYAVAASERAHDVCEWERTAEVAALSERAIDVAQPAEGVLVVL